MKQTTIIDRFRSGKNVTQKMLDQKLVNLIIDETLPLAIVDKPSFIDLMKLGLPNTMSIMCSKTLRKHLMVRFTETKEKIIIQMGNAQNVATTTDCWSHGRKSYIGVTAHWINLDTLQREHAALACSRLFGKHTYDVLAKKCMIYIKHLKSIIKLF